MSIPEGAFIPVIVGMLLVTSCIEPYELRLDAENADLTNTLCVAANAKITGDELAFAAAVAPIRPLYSGTTDFEYYPLDSLILEINVDGNIYCSDSLAENSMFGNEKGFIINKIPINSDTPEVKMRILDKAGNYRTVSASGKALRKPEMQVEVVFATLCESDSYLPEQYANPDWRYRELRCPDSLYHVKVTINPSKNDLHHYLMSVEFEFYFGNLSRYSEFNTKLFEKLCEVPFNGDNEHFFDSKITSSLSGFPAYYGNTFSCDGLAEENREVIIQFVNPALKMYRNFDFHSNAQAPFHIYLCEIDIDTYEYYKTIQHRACSSSSIFNALNSASTASNIDGGTGYFSIHNMQDFVYIDDRKYNYPDHMDFGK